MPIPSMPCIARISASDLIDEVWAVLRRYPSASGGKDSYQMTTLVFLSQAHGVWRNEHADELENDRDPLTLNCKGWAFRMIADWTRDPLLRTLPLMYAEGKQWLVTNGKPHAYPLAYCYRELSPHSEKVLAYVDPQEAAITTLPMAEFRAMDYLAVNARHGIMGQFTLL